MAKRTARKAKRKGQMEGLLETVRKVNTEQPPMREVANLDQHRQNPEVWRAASDLKELAHTAILKPFAPPARAAIRQQLETFQEKLGYAESPTIERLLIEQVGTSWLHLQIIQLIYPSGQGEGWERRLTAAQRRYLKAIETLARVRRLLRPKAVQANIGAQRVNVAETLQAPGKVRNNE